MAQPVPPITKDMRGAAIVEFALLLPLLICLLMGVLGYGQYFLLAHSVQQIANDAARATVPGLSATERASLARQSVTDDVAALGQFAATRASSWIDESGNSVAIEQEMMKTGEIKRDYELSAGLVKAFHRMMLMTVRK